MQGPPPKLPEGAEMLQAGGRGGTGNILYLFQQTHPPLVLKVYRPRRSRLRESFKNFSERILEGKRGATAVIRCATEKLNIDLWTNQGFDVVQRVEQPLPAGVAPPALWLEYCPHPVLWDVLTDPECPTATKRTRVEVLGASLGRRHSRALELNEPLLVHEHGHIKHYFVQGDRLIAFDLEHGFKPGYPVVKAVTREISGIAYSLARADEAAAEKLLRAFAACYANKALLKQVVTEATRGGGLLGRVRRWRERKRDSTYDKTSVMERLGELLESGASRA